MTQSPPVSKDTLSRVASAFADHHMEVLSFANRDEALAKIKELIPKGASVIHGSSTTLQEIGYIDYLKGGAHGWKNLQEQIFAEADPATRELLRKQASISDFYLGSVHALTEEGELVISSATGSQLPGIVFNAANLIFVVGVQKIVPTLGAAFKRIKEHVIPLENTRMQKAYGTDTTLAKTLIFHREHPMTGRKVRVLLVNETLGF